MTPRELFDIAHNLSSKYEAAQLVEEIVKNNSPKLLSVFLQELEELRMSEYSDKLWDGVFVKERESFNENWRIIYDEYGLDMGTYEEPTLDNYRPFIHYDFFVNQLTEALEAATPTTSGQPEQASDPLNLPPEMDTPDARKYLGECGRLGWIKPTGNGAISNIPQIRLAYICSKIYNNPRPIKALEEYFGVHNLAASITQAEVPSKRADVIRWRNEIDNLIFNKT